MKAKAYHHGDLRTALVTTGLALLAQRDADGLSLRELARAVGVSATAVYRHFPDKRTLMTALALEGLRQLSAAQHAASDEAGGEAAGFIATGRAYVRFALANPALFRLIFANPTPLDLPEEERNAPTGAMAFLQANAAARAAPGVEPRVVALQAWSLAHGLAMLMLDAQVAPEDGLIDSVMRAPLISDGRRTSSS